MIYLNYWRANIHPLQDILTRTTLNIILETNIEAIDTDEWKFVRPEYVNGKYTGNWIPSSGGGGILNNDEFIKELLSNPIELEEAKIPTNGGRRKRQTKVKSKKRANKRRTRSRK